MPALRIHGRCFAPFERALRRQVAALPVALEFEEHWLEFPDLRRRLLDESACRDGSADLVLVPTDWLEELIADEHIVPLDDALPDDWPDAWSASLRQLQTDDRGHVYGLPYHDGPTVLLYRRDMIETPPRTWDEFLATAARFTVAGEGRWGTILAGRADGHNDVYDFVAQLVSRGGALLDDRGAPAFASPAGVEALRFLHDVWHGRRVVDPAARGWDSVESGRRFADGGAALMVNWAGYAAMSVPASSPTHGLVACAPAPGRALNAYWTMAVAAGCRDVPLARSVIRQLAGPAMDRITAEEGATAVRRDTWADPGVRALAPYYAILEEAHRDAVTLPRTRRLPQLGAVLSELGQDALWRGVEPTEALERASRRASEVLGAETTRPPGERSA